MRKEGFALLPFDSEHLKVPRTGYRVLFHQCTIFILGGPGPSSLTINQNRWNRPSPSAIRTSSPSLSTNLWFHFKVCDLPFLYDFRIKCKSHLKLSPYCSGRPPVDSGPASVSPWDPRCRSRFASLCEGGDLSILSL